MMMNSTPVRTYKLLTVIAAAAMFGCATQEGRLKTDTFVARKKLTGELVARQEWETAFAYADELHREQPRDAEVLVLRGKIYREKGLPAEAESDLLNAIKLDENFAEAHAALAIVYDVGMRPHDAEKQHKEAVRLEPRNAMYLNNLGFSLYLRGKNHEAIKVYSEATRLMPTNRRLRTNLGFALAATGDFRRAAHEFEMGGVPAEAKNNLGFAYERKGDLKNAYELYAEAVRLDPASTKVRSNLANAAHVLGRELPPDLPPVPPAAATSSGPPAVPILSTPSAQPDSKEEKKP
jgi:Flp pilus assembly protein TadD